MHTIVEMPEFARQVKKLGLSEDERDGIVDALAKDPSLGDEIPGTRGMRKVRVAPRDKGKSGGYRVIHFFSGENMPVFLVTMYLKSKKETLTNEEKQGMKSLADQIINVYRRKGK